MNSEICGYKFKNIKLLEQAMTHPSFAAENNNTENYERLEFLGDAVLQLCVSDILIERYPNENEGQLAKRRAALVCGDSLTKIAKEIDIGAKLRLGTGEDNSGGRKNSANLENALEALLAAIYLDGGVTAAEDFVQKTFRTLIEEMKEPPQDPKTALQEWAQSHGFEVPEYIMAERSGPSHAPEFTIEVRVQGQEPVSFKAGNKKLAEREAAKIMLEKLK